MRNLRTPRGRVHRSLTLFIGSTLNSRTDRRTGFLSRTVCLCEREQDSVEIAGLTPFWTPASVVLVFFSVVSPSCALRPDCSKPGLRRRCPVDLWNTFGLVCAICCYFSVLASFILLANFGKLDQKDSWNNGTLASLSMEALSTV